MSYIVCLSSGGACGGGRAIVRASAGGGQHASSAGERMQLVERGSARNSGWRASERVGGRTRRSLRRRVLFLHAATCPGQQRRIPQQMESTAPPPRSRSLLGRLGRRDGRVDARRPGGRPSLMALWGTACCTPCLRAREASPPARSEHMRTGSGIDTSFPASRSTRRLRFSSRKRFLSFSLSLFS